MQHLYKLHHCIIGNFNTKTKFNRANASTIIHIHKYVRTYDIRSILTYYGMGGNRTAMRMQYKVKCVTVN